jgi:hypothetical protein
MDTKTSPVSPIVSANHHLFFGNVCLFVLTRWLPHLFSPARAALFGLVVYKPQGRRVAKPKICRKASLLGNARQSPPCQHGLVSNGKSHLVMDPSDVARRVVESNLRVVWRGSQRVNVSVCIYVCM